MTKQFQFLLSRAKFSSGEAKNWVCWVVTIPSASVQRILKKSISNPSIQSKLKRHYPWKDVFVHSTSIPDHWSRCKAIAEHPDSHTKSNTDHNSMGTIHKYGSKCRFLLLQIQKFVSEVDIWRKCRFSLVDLEGLEATWRSEFFTSSEEIVVTQHTKKSDRLHQNFAQESKNWNCFVTNERSRGTA